MLHIDLPTRADIERLIAHRAAPAVSLYLRTTPLTQDAQADRIELRNLLRAAVAEMEAGGTAKRDIRAIEDAVEALADDDEVWAEQAHSLAVFATPDSLRSFRLPNRLTNEAEVSDRFHIKPLLRSLTFRQHAYVVAIGMGGVRLVEVSADLPPNRVKVPGLPRDAADAAGRGSHIERKGGMASGEATSESALLTRYARAVDRALRPVLAGQDDPVVIAAAEPLASVFRGVCSHPHVAAEVLPGSPDHTPDHDLAEAARRVLDGLHAAELAEVAALYARRGAQGRATGDIAQAARAATFGAVDTLIVDMDAEMPGTVDDEDGTVAFAAEADAANYGVTDEIARRVLGAGGRVMAVRAADVPGGGKLAAILRWPV